MDRAIGPRRRILVVDDDEAIQQLVVGSVDGEHDVTIACDGQDALARIERGERYALIISEVILPRITGPALRNALAAFAPEQSENIVFFTTPALPAGLDVQLAALPNAVLRKPISAPMFREFVRALLS